MRFFRFGFSLASMALLVCSAVAAAYIAAMHFVGQFLKIAGPALTLFRLPTLAESRVLVGNNGASGIMQSAFERTYSQRSAARNT